MPKVLMLILTWAIFSSAVDARAGELEQTQHMIWLGGGLTQQESFWAERAPLFPTGFLRYENKIGHAFFSNTAWKSPLSFLGGLYGVSQWHAGTNDIGDNKSQLYGELGFGAGPEKAGSVFVLGARVIGLAFGGVEYTRLNVLGETRDSFVSNLGFSSGISLHAGFKNVFIKQEMLLGYGLRGYQNHLRTGFVITF